MFLWFFLVSLSVNFMSLQIQKEALAKVEEEKLKVERNFDLEKRGTPGKPLSLQSSLKKLQS